MPNEPDEQDTKPVVPGREPSILSAAMGKFHEQQEAGLAGLDIEPKPPVKPAEEAPPETKPPTSTPPDGDDDEAEIDSIKVDDIRTKAGIPISENAKEKFKKLETSRNRWKAKVADYEKKVAEFEQKLAATNTSATDIENAPELKALKEENAKLRESQDLLFFEQSDEWKNTFEKPIAAISERITSIIGSAVKTIAPSLKPELTMALNRANALLGNPESEAEYDSIVDGITENILTGTAGAKLARAMQDVWSLAIERNKARADKAAAREAITTKQRAERDRSKKSLEDLLSLQETAFEQTPVGQAFSKTFADQFGYTENKSIGKKMVQEALDVFLKTGVATPELSEALHHASLKRVHDKEREFLLTGYNTMAAMVETQKKQIADLEKRVNELRGGTGERPTPKDVKDSKEKQRDTSKPFSLASRLEETLNSFSR